MERRTRGNSNMNDLTMDAFIQIPNKILLLSSAIESLNISLIKTIKEESQLTRKVIQDCFNAANEISNDKKEFMDNMNKKTIDIIELSINKITDVIANANISTPIPITKEQKLHCNLTEKAEKSMSEMESVWKSNIQKRRQAYWEFYKRKETLAIYEEEIQKEHPKMPRKLQPKIIDNEPEEEHKIRKDHAIENLRTEMKLLKLREQRKEKEFKEIDETITQLITEKHQDNMEIRSELLEAWEKECKQQQRKSEEIFQKKRDWLVDNLTEEDRSTNSREDKRQTDGKKAFLRRDYPPRGRRKFNNRW